MGAAWKEGTGISWREGVMMSSLGRSLLGLTFPLLAASVVLAGPLASDPNAIADFTGSVTFNAAGKLIVDLDYAVFEPGRYPDDGVTGDDPSDGTEYVYAYQAFVSPDSTHPLTAVSIGLADGHGVSGPTVGDPLHEQTGGIDVFMSALLPNSVVTLFGDGDPAHPPVWPGEYSVVFVYTSPNPPTWASAVATGAGFTNQQLVPSPIPEPTRWGCSAWGW